MEVGAVVDLEIVTAMVVSLEMVVAIVDPRVFKSKSKT